MNYDIYINGTIGGWGTTADYVRYRLSSFKKKRCDVAVCSLGGYVTDGMEIYQLFKDHGDVHVHFIGMSASAATFLAMGAKEVTMGKNALLLIHNASNVLFKYGSHNKEQIDALIGELKKNRDDLNTIDDVIANIYADRCGKSVDDVKEKMKVAAWLSPSQCLELGIVDSITETMKEDGAQNIYFNAVHQPTDEELKELGLPPMPKEPEAQEHPTDDEGILKRLARMFGINGQAPITNLASQDNNTNTMLKIFATVAALLAVDGFSLNKEDNIELTQDQLKTLDDQLKTLNDALKAKDEEIKNLKEQKPASNDADLKKISDLEAQLQKVKDDLKAKDEQIENLKKSAEPDTAHEAEPEKPVDLYSML